MTGATGEDAQATEGLAELEERLCRSDPPADVLEELAQRLAGSIPWDFHPDRRDAWRSDALNLWRGQVHFMWARDIARRVEQARREGIEGGLGLLKMAERDGLELRDARVRRDARRAALEEAAQLVVQDLEIDALDANRLVWSILRLAAETDGGAR